MIRLNITVPFYYDNLDQLRDRICDIIDWEDEDYSSFLNPDSGIFNYIEDDDKSLISEDDIIDFVQKFSYLLLSDCDDLDDISEASVKIEEV